MEVIPGTVLSLKEPWKLSDDKCTYENVLRIGYLLSKSVDIGVQRDAYRNWDGFTHGLIVYMEYHYSIHEIQYEVILYDPENGLIYCEKDGEIPTVTLGIKDFDTTFPLDFNNVLKRPSQGYLSD